MILSKFSAAAGSDFMFLILGKGITAGRRRGSINTRRYHSLFAALEHSVPAAERNDVFIDMAYGYSMHYTGFDMVQISMRQHMEARQRGILRRFAINISEHSPGFGIARMFQGFCNAFDNLDAQIFPTGDEGLRWLGSDRRYAELSIDANWQQAVG